jgi:hypothetical protein
MVKPVYKVKGTRKCALNKQLPLKDGSNLAALFNKWMTRSVNFVSFKLQKVLDKRAMGQNEMSYK